MTLCWCNEAPLGKHGNLVGVCLFWQPLADDVHLPRWRELTVMEALRVFHPTGPPPKKKVGLHSEKLEL